MLATDELELDRAEVRRGLVHPPLRREDAQVQSTGEVEGAIDEAAQAAESGIEDADKSAQSALDDAHKAATGD